MRPTTDMRAAFDRMAARQREELKMSATINETDVPAVIALLQRFAALDPSQLPGDLTPDEIAVVAEHRRRRITTELENKGIVIRAAVQYREPTSQQRNPTYNPHPLLGERETVGPAFTGQHSLANIDGTIPASLPVAGSPSLPGDWIVAPAAFDPPPEPGARVEYVTFGGIRDTAVVGSPLWHQVLPQIERYRTVRQ